MADEINYQGISTLISAALLSGGAFISSTVAAYISLANSRRAVRIEERQKAIAVALDGQSKSLNAAIAGKNLAEGKEVGRVEGRDEERRSPTSTPGSD